MIISDTSALVLHWTSKNIWKSKNALTYFEGLDISASDGLIRQFDETENYMHTQAVSNRKFFVRQSAIDFLKQCKTAGQQGQVIILAAGIAPLSVEIASLYPEVQVFDIDKYLMAEKEAYLDNRCPNIRFIECDITDVPLLNQQLEKNGWKASQPSLIIMEGIIYYLKEAEFKNILNFFGTNNSRFSGDFGLKPECIDETNRVYGTEVFRKIRESIGIGPVSLFEPGYFMDLLAACGFSSARRWTMGDVQMDRTGEKKPFESNGEPGWISMVKN